MNEAAPQLLLSTAPFFRSPLREAFRQTREAGYDAVEVMVTSDPATQDARSVRDLAAEFELDVGALHAPFLLLTRRVWGTDPVNKIYRAVQEADEAEIPLVVVHPPYRWQTRYRRWLEERLPDFSAGSGVTVAMENMFPLKIRGERGVTFHAGQELEDLDRFDDLVLDTSHLAVSRFDIVEAYRRYRDKVRHFHISNNAGKGWDSHLPVDEGILPLDDLLSEIARDRYTGGVALELDLRPFIHDPTAVHEVLVRNREFCEHLLGART